MFKKPHSLLCRTFQYLVGWLKSREGVKFPWAEKGRGGLRALTHPSFAICRTFRENPKEERCLTHLRKIDPADPMFITPRESRRTFGPMLMWMVRLWLFPYQYLCHEYLSCADYIPDIFTNPGSKSAAAAYEGIIYVCNPDFCAIKCLRLGLS